MTSAWAIYANGELWDLLNGGAVAPHTARIFQTNRAFASEDGPIAARTLGLVIGRYIDGGLQEDIDIANNARSRYASIWRLRSVPISPIFSRSPAMTLCGVAALSYHGRRSGKSSE